MDLEIEYLKRTQNGPINVAALKSLKQLRKMFDKEVDAPQPFKQILETWNKFRIIGISAVVEDEFPALTKSWKHLQSEFGEWAFDESMIDAWCFFNFPCHENLTFSEIFSLRDDIPEELKAFAQQMTETRLGLYETVLNSGKFMRMRELLTGNIVEVHNTMMSNHGNEIYLARLLPIDDKFMMFGDPSAFPADSKDQLEAMVESKMLLYYGDAPSSYDDHMRHSGPYWISVVSENKNVDILNPDYQKCYFDTFFKLGSLPEWLIPKSTEAEAKKLKAKKVKRKAARKARKRNR